ncbi:MAG: ABC transporter substrate-binding protein [Nitrospirae bacterium]|nr:ABC transporter substrate-binding protein [Nitrospirota bacterium]MCL5238327.1 ABC transporter substrate-binding protein [Nitrospirota bacterium]
MKKGALVVRVMFLAMTMIAAILFSVLTGYAAEPIKIVVGWQPYDTISYQVAIIQELKLWKKYMPEGVQVEFEPALQGAIISNNLLAGKQQIGYMSILPGIMAATKPEQANIRLVASTGHDEGQRCSIIMARKDAPNFKSPEEAVRWLDGKIVAAPKGSCADQYFRLLMDRLKIKPKEYLNQSLEVIATNFRVGKIDAAALWEPTVSRIGTIVGEGTAKIVATGKVIKNIDSGSLVMRGDFIDKYPHLAAAYIKAELEAQRYMVDPRNWDRVIDMLSKYATGIPKRVLWYSLYGQIPPEVGGTKERAVRAFIFTNDLRKNIEDMYVFLHKEKIIRYDKPLPGTIDDAIARKVLKAEKLKSPLGTIIGQPASKAPKD